ncbi:hypothetical protein VA596_31780 [Amycolatopsis sp., V23-08]|uniref:Thioredoxin domain-containing protein n=1 Tax=Amycolatopsis heterodermiae TaxID=3110235 RepID=A0ABU5RD10_9PSEU|nr:hypothetical protein [Amycolatopsis sp., V23-08]MEA5364152.1 hypothetical protein [Amycolatopsis sp., V23-08]
MTGVAGHDRSVSALRWRSVEVCAGGVLLCRHFWAYSCINCQRAIPHVEAWDQRYRGAGLEVVGVHTPEYAFEHVPVNVADGTTRQHITYPVAIGNDYATWNAFGNQSWPAEYLADATGQVRHVSLGEGDYDGTESLIRELLTTADPARTLPPRTDVADDTPTNPLQSPETYLGSERGVRSISRVRGRRRRNFSPPTTTPPTRSPTTPRRSTSTSAVRAPSPRPWAASRRRSRCPAARTFMPSCRRRRLSRARWRSS